MKQRVPLLYSTSESMLLRFGQLEIDNHNRSAASLLSEPDVQSAVLRGEQTMTSHARESELYARLQEVLGPQPAETLMTMLPTTAQYATKADLAGLVTKSDLAELRAEVKSDIAELKQDMRELRGELRNFVRTLVVAQTTAMVGLTGIFIAVTRLL